MMRLRHCSLLALSGLVLLSCYVSHTRQDDSSTVSDAPESCDRDGDTISNEDERNIYHTDPDDSDTDGDGASDLVEIAAGTDPRDGRDVIQSDVIHVILPYAAPSDEHVEVHFDTLIEIADVYFLIDTTASMDHAIDGVANSLAGTIVPGLREAIVDVQMGVGHYNDCPNGFYGRPPDQPFWHVQDITPDDDLVQDALDTLRGSRFPWGGGGDEAESQVIALWSAATGNGFTECESNVPAQTCPVHPGDPGMRLGYPCFRSDALPIIVNVSDASWHSDESGLSEYGCTDLGFDDALAGLNSIGARHLGVVVGEWEYSMASMRAMSLGTNAVDATGNALVVQTESGNIGTAIVDMISELATATPQDVHCTSRDEPDDPAGADYDATVFIQDISPKRASPDAPVGFTHMDETTFYGVTPNTRVTFGVDFHNDTIPQTGAPQGYWLWISAWYNDVTFLDERKVLVIVPPERCSD